MRTKRNWLTTVIVAILLMSLAAPLVAVPAFATEDDEDEVRIVSEREDWYKLESDIVTVLFPRGGRKPMFIWWYTGAPGQIYVVKYQGLIEWFAFEDPSLPSNPDYYNRLREAWQETWRERFARMYFEPEQDRWMNYTDRLRLLQQIMTQIHLRMESEWHRPFLPFDAGRWTLGDFANITLSDGKIIGISFAFRLVELPDWMPNLQFAENNIMIRVRFYNETVQETVPGTDFSYTVNAGEMKMDFVVNKWEWNIDTLKQLMLELQQAGFDIRIPEIKSRLALWVNLASFNITKLAAAEDEPDEIEDYSTTTHMEIEDVHTDVTENKTEVEYERPIEIDRPIIKLKFANETAKFGGFFRFVSSAKIKDYPSKGDVKMVPVKAAYISGGAHLRLFIGYPYFGDGSLEHDPSLGVDDVSSVDSTPSYIVKVPTGMNANPVVLGRYVMPLFTTELMVALIVVVSAAAAFLYVFKWKRKTPVNMVGAGTTG